MVWRLVERGNKTLGLRGLGANPLVRWRRLRERQRKHPVAIAGACFRASEPMPNIAAMVASRWLICGGGRRPMQATRLSTPKTKQPNLNEAAG
jgi:hypothetical protein